MVRHSRSKNEVALILESAYQDQSVVFDSQSSVENAVKFHAYEGLDRSRYLSWEKSIPSKCDDAESSQHQAVPKVKLGQFEVATYRSALVLEPKAHLCPLK